MRTNHRQHTTLIIALLLAVAGTTAAFASGYPGNLRLTAAELLRITARPDSKSKAVDLLLYGDPLLVTGSRGAWLRVQPACFPSGSKPVSGWVPAAQITQPRQPAAHMTNLVVLHNSGKSALIPLYRAEGKRYKAVSFVYDGTTLPLLAVTNGAYYLLLPDGKPAMANNVRTVPLNRTRQTLQNFYKALQKAASDTTVQGLRLTTAELIRLAARSCGAYPPLGFQALRTASRPLAPQFVTSGDLVFFDNRQYGIVAPGANFIYSRNGQPGFLSLFSPAWQKRITGYRRLKLKRPQRQLTVRRRGNGYWSILLYQCRQRSSLLPLLRRQPVSRRLLFIKRITAGRWGIFSGLYRTRSAALRSKPANALVRRFGTVAGKRTGSSAYALQQMALLNPARALNRLLDRLDKQSSGFLWYTRQRDGKIWLRLLNGWFGNRSTALQQAAQLRRRTNTAPLLKRIRLQ